MLIITTGFILFLAFKNEPTKNEPMDESIQHEPKEELEEDVPTEEVQLNDTEEVVNREDPVKDFLSEKLRQAADFFFTQDIKVVTLGDSLTEGSGDETKNGGYVGVLDDTINRDKHVVDFQNFAKRGSRTDQLLLRLEDEEVINALNHADIILITIGANDIMKVFKENITDLTLEKFTAEQNQYKQRLEQVFSTIQGFNGEADIYLIGFYNPFKKYFADIEELEHIVSNWNQIGLNVTEQYNNANFIPIKDIFDQAESNYFADDNFHPNALGYRMIAERVLQYVLNEGERDANTEATIQ